MIEFKLFLCTFTSSYPIFLACCHCLVVIGDKVTCMDCKGTASTHPIFILNQTEARKKIFWDLFPPASTPLSEGLDLPLPFPIGKVGLKYYLPSKKNVLVLNTQMGLLSSPAKVLRGWSVQHDVLNVLGHSRKLQTVWLLYNRIDCVSAHVFWP